MADSDVHFRERALVERQRTERQVWVGGKEPEGGRVGEGSLKKSGGQIVQKWNETSTGGAASKGVDSRGFYGSVIHQMWVGMKMPLGFWLGRLGGLVTVIYMDKRCMWKNRFLV